MEPFITIASVSIKAVHTYFTKVQAEQLCQVVDTNERLIAYAIYHQKQQKSLLLQQANRYLQESLLSDRLELRRNLLNQAFAIYSQLILLPKIEQMPDGTSFSNCEYISGGYYGRFCYTWCIRNTLCF